MPYIAEKIKLPHEYDRRRKLSDEQRQEIIKLYSTGNYSLRQLGRKYNVDKGTISLIVNPEMKLKYQKYNQENWRRHQTHGEEHNATIREHRAYKHKLYKEGKLNTKGDDAND